MNIKLRIVLFLALILYYAIIVSLLREKKLALKYTLLWLITGIVMLLCLIFPEGLEKLLHMIGIIDLTNGLFAVVLFLLIIISASLTSIVSRFNNRLRQLIQQCALYEKRIRELEGEIHSNGVDLDEDN